MQSLYRAFLETDASLLEINPLIVTGDGRLVALDAKVNFDDNALYRHPEFKDLRDLDEENPLEVEASKFKLNYIKLDGNVGCMVNGAGLAMATMDIIKLSGGSPANFLDVGGGASEEQVKNAFRILLSDPNVKARLHQYFRRHLALRRAGQRRGERREGTEIQSAGGRAHGRHQRGAGPGNLAQLGPEFHGRRAE